MTYKATVLNEAKLHAKKNTDDFEIGTNFPQIFIVIDLRQHHSHKIITFFFLLYNTPMGSPLDLLMRITLKLWKEASRKRNQFVGNRD